MNFANEYNNNNANSSRRTYGSIIDNIVSFETAFFKNKESVKGSFKNKWGGAIAPKLLWTD